MLFNKYLYVLKKDIHWYMGTNMLDPTMYLELLAAPYIIENFVVGEEKCNYEIYLLEVLNNSTWFSTRYPGIFTKPNSESHGECDANNQSYQIDFKLFASKTALQARSILSNRAYKIEQGVVGFGGSKVPNGEIQSTKIYAAFRGKSLPELYCIRGKQTKAYGIETDIKTTLEILETNKNLLLFFPYEFKFNRYHNYDEGTNSIIEELVEDFHVAFEYRDIQTQKQYDTFMTCIYKRSFLIFLIENQALKLVDKIDIEKVPTFLRLSEYVEWL